MLARWLVDRVGGGVAYSDDAAIEVASAARARDAENFMLI